MGLSWPGVDDPAHSIDTARRGNRKGEMRWGSPGVAGSAGGMADGAGRRARAPNRKDDDVDVYDDDDGLHARL
jgi:hypothetical protein